MSGISEHGRVFLMSLKCNTDEMNRYGTRPINQDAHDFEEGIFMFSPSFPEGSSWTWAEDSDLLPPVGLG